MTLIQMNVLRRNIDRGCRYEVDLGGVSYHLPAGPAEDRPRSRNLVWQNYAMEYLLCGAAPRSSSRVSPRERGLQSRDFPSHPKLAGDRTRRSLCHSAAATVICCGQRQLNQLSKPRSAVAQAVFLVLEPAL